ncbi:TlpA disulfide reductase family protein [Chitinophaga varians]|uniref:TlpA disulfide reductase family protein n=1 Tax=Chitinophaga varians TaxID=2202339 RepID=UPI00165F134A|nr:TlpA disulfide reductase family protein [Chitinophaga varians]MBC9912402.1 AhpC/TSA family protein [Chitinophaga varians]
MKKITTTIIGCMALTAFAYAQEKKPFVLNGKVTDQPNGKLYLMYEDVTGNRNFDSVVLKNGRFTVRGEIVGPAVTYIRSGRGDDSPALVVLMPGSQQFTAAENKLSLGRMSGNNANAGVWELQQEKALIQQKHQSRLDSLRNEKNHDAAAAIRERLAPFFEENDQADYHYFRKYPTSALTAYMLRYHVADLPLDTLQQYYDKLGAATQHSGFAKYIADELNSLRHGSPGAVAADFTAKDIQGNSLSLSQYKGRYVLLDFWASWCVPCRKGNPHLKELYARYQSKGWEIIGISDDDRNEKAWKTAVAKDDLPWKHVLRGLDMSRLEDNPNDISLKYGIHSLPTKILIDPKGVIIGRYGSEGDELDKKLKAIYGE